jgi:hypothetical protein
MTDHTTPVDAAEDIGLDPLVGALGRIRDVTPADMQAIASYEHSAALVEVRASITAPGVGWEAPLGISAVALVGLAALVSMTDLEALSTTWLIAIAATLVVFLLAGIVWWIVEAISRHRATAWAYVLDHRIGELAAATEAHRINSPQVNSPSASFKGTFAPSLVSVVRRARNSSSPS